MTVVWEAESDAIQDFEEAPPDRHAPSENFLNCPDAEDVPEIELYEMLSEGLRIWDQQSGRVYERLLEEPSRLLGHFFQKIWKLACIHHYNKCPDDLLDYIAWHVGFGEQQGAATELWKLLDNDQKRILIKIAVKLWKRRGRLDLLSDAIALFASYISPRIITWFWRRALVGEIRIGKEDRPATDLTTTLTEHVVDASETDIYLTLIRVPDLGELNREIVEAIADLCRPSNETFEIAYVDYIDTFHDGRNGYWYPVDPSKAATFRAGDGSTEPETLPAMVLVSGTWERIVTPTSPTWTDKIISFVYKPTQTPLGPPPHNFADMHVFFHSQADDPISGYSVWFNRNAIHHNVNLCRWDAGVETVLHGANLYDPNLDHFRGNAARGVTIDVQDIGGGDHHIKVYIDEILVMDYTIVAASYTQGTVEFRNDTPALIDNTIELSMVEVYQRPLDITTLAP